MKKELAGLGGWERRARALTQPWICFVTWESLPICKMGTILNIHPSRIIVRIKSDHPGNTLTTVPGVQCPGIHKPGLTGQIHPRPVFVNNIFLEHSHAHLFMLCLWPISHGRVPMACKAKNICLLALYRKRSPILMSNISYYHYKNKMRINTSRTLNVLK